MGIVLLLTPLPGVSQAGDVAWAEARGSLGMNATQEELPAREVLRASTGGAGSSPWVELAGYLVVASLVFAMYALAIRGVPWLRPGRRPKA